MGKQLSPITVRSLFDYHDGLLIWRRRPIEMFDGHRACSAWNARFADKPAGHIHKVRSGYRRRVAITLNGVTERIYASRLVWVWHRGEWPIGLVDHDDGDTLNDRIGNLRDVPEAVNSQNMKRHPGNKSGVTGVCWHRQRGKWKAEITANRVKRHLGVFDSLEDAAAARRRAEAQLGFHPNHGRRGHVAA